MRETKPHNFSLFFLNHFLFLIDFLALIIVHRISFKVAQEDYKDDYLKKKSLSDFLNQRLHRSSELPKTVSILIIRRPFGCLESGGKDFYL